jgi:hypothetical protein
LTNKIDSPERENLKRLLLDKTCDTCFYKGTSTKRILFERNGRSDIVEIDTCRLYGCQPGNMTCKDWKDKNSDALNSILIG